MKKIKDIFNKIKDKKINYDKWFVRLTILIEIMLVIIALFVFFRIQDLFNRYHELKVEMYEIREEIK